MERIEQLEKLKEDLFYSVKIEKITQLEQELKSEKVWSDWELGQKIAQDLADIKRDVSEIEDLELYLLDEQFSKFDKKLKSMEIKAFLNEKHDKDSCFLSIHAGQGGTDAMDWVELLLRMYQRYAEIKNWKTKIVSQTVGDVAGLKTVTIEIDGSYCYGFLKRESGVHRLVRLSPFNSDNLRQTSFALIEVLPVLPEDIEIEIKPEDVHFEAFRSSGAGGQNVNKVSTAVRLKHIPTGITVECQEERHQGKNREKAMKKLKAELYAIELRKLEEKKDKLKGIYKAPGWGNQIRNYVLHPYKLVKDLRTDVESHDPDSVLDGNLKDFIEAQIKL